MGIISLLAILGVMGLLSARDNRTATGTADQFVSELRQARNYALETHTVAYDPGGGNPICNLSPKFWALRVTTNPSQLERWYYSDNTCHVGWYQDPAPIDNEFKAKNTINRPGQSTGAILFIYNVPFGKFYQIPTAWSPDDPTNGINAAKILSDVSLFGSLKPIGADTTNTYTVRFASGGAYSNVVVNSLSGQVTK
jgi:hypothetical protein